MNSETLRQFFPEQYEALNKVLVLPTLNTSVVAARNKFFQDHKHDYVSYRMMVDSTGQKIPMGQCLVFAEDGYGNQALFFVNKERYEANVTPFGYVVDEVLDEKRVLA